MFFKGLIIKYNKITGIVVIIAILSIKGKNSFNGNTKYFGSEFKIKIGLLINIIKNKVILETRILTGFVFSLLFLKLNYCVF